MQYKDNVLNRLTQTDAIVMRLQLQINRNVSKDEIEETIESLKESVDGVREMVSMESDDFAQQFKRANS